MKQTEMKLKENQFSVWPVKMESKMIRCMLQDGQNQYLGCCKRYTDAWQIPNLKVHYTDLIKRDYFFILFLKDRLFTEAAGEPGHLCLPSLGEEEWAALD